jgi:phospholipid/cholesterol/gamma-HCH transport system permease protein
MVETFKQESNHMVISDKEGTALIRFKGALNSSNAGCLIRKMNTLLGNSSNKRVIVDLGEVTFMDDFGSLVLLEVKRIASALNSTFQMINASPRVKKMLAMIHFERLGGSMVFEKRETPDLFTRLGGATLKQAADLKYLISFVGSVCLSLFFVCLHPKSLRSDDTFVCMQKTGVDAFPIVALISFLLGLIMAFMSAAQLQQFGANIYVASLVSLAMVRELGPIMTAIIVAGRSGSAFAAEIGTMKISEEVDALFTMGFDTTRFLVVPKVIASVFVLPFLALFSDVFAMLGGLLVGVHMLDLTASAYAAQTMDTLTLFDVSFGFVKSAVFGLLIAWVGCLRGFRARGGAASVGQATTSAVVSSIFLIILSDSVFAVLLRYWG